MLKLTVHLDKVPILFVTFKVASLRKITNQTKISAYVVKLHNAYFVIEHFIGKKNRPLMKQ